MSVQLSSGRWHTSFMIWLQSFSPTWTTSQLDPRNAPNTSMIYESSFNGVASTTSTWILSSVCSASPQGTSLVLLFPKAILPWTPSKSKPSPKFHLHGIYDNCRVYREKLTFCNALFLIMPSTHTVSSAYYVTTSLFIRMTMPNSHLTILKQCFQMHL